MCIGEIPWVLLLEEIGFSYVGWVKNGVMTSSNGSVRTMSIACPLKNSVSKLVGSLALGVTGTK